MESVGTSPTISKIFSIDKPERFVQYSVETAQEKLLQDVQREPGGLLDCIHTGKSQYLTLAVYVLLI